MLLVEKLAKDRLSQLKAVIGWKYLPYIDSSTRRPNSKYTKQKKAKRQCLLSIITLVSAVYYFLSLRRFFSFLWFSVVFCGRVSGFQVFQLPVGGFNIYFLLFFVLSIRRNFIIPWSTVKFMPCNNRIHFIPENAKNTILTTLWTSLILETNKHSRSCSK